MKTLRTFVQAIKTMAFAATALTIGLQPAAAQLAYPSERTVRLLVGFAAGGPTDNAARLVAEELGKHLGQKIIVENKPGANSLVAALELMRSKPDGYTLMLASNGTLAVAPARYSRLPYDVKKDFTPIGSVVAYPHVLVVSSGSKASDVPSLINMAKGRSQELNSASVGHVNDLTIEWFQKLAGIKLTLVPYKGDSAVVSDLVANRIDMTFLAPNVAFPLVEGKKLKALGITGAKAASKGNVPAIQDTLAGFQMEIWNGLVAPAGTNLVIVNQLSSALKTTLQSPDLQAKLALSGQHVVIDTPTEFTAKIDEEGKRWKTIAKDANLPLLEQ
jgi:tripartite-type tricarboxylate transporter receptor subunit TctC